MPTPEPAPALRQVNVDSGRNHLSAGGGKFRGEVLRGAGGGGGGEAWQVRGRALPGPGSGIVLTSVGMRCSSVKVDDQDYWATPRRPRSLWLLPSISLLLSTPTGGGGADLVAFPSQPASSTGNSPPGPALCSCSQLGWLTGCSCAFPGLWISEGSATRGAPGEAHSVGAGTPRVGPERQGTRSMGAGTMRMSG